MATYTVGSIVDSQVYLTPDTRDFQPISVLQSKTGIHEEQTHTPSVIRGYVKYGTHPQTAKVYLMSDRKTHHIVAQITDTHGYFEFRGLTTNVPYTLIATPISTDHTIITHLSSGVLDKVFPIAYTSCEIEIETAPYYDIQLGVAIPEEFNKTLSGNCHSSATIIVRDWTSKAYIGTTTTITGEWSLQVPIGSYDITYLKDDCVPTCHGPYEIN